MNKEADKIIDKKAEEIYNSLMEKPLKVLDIFNDFFGEDRIDMQGYVSLEEFKRWLNGTPIYMYISDIKIVNMTEEEWEIYYNSAIKDLPTEQFNKVIYNLENLKNKIGFLKFSDIFILIHFPHVTVTNEHDRSVDINHLWAKVKVSFTGTLNGHFGLNRSEYTLLHISSGYMHSHVPGIPFNNFTEFMSPCLGTGPIRSTIMSLNSEYNEDLWNMFCLELSKYVSVESIAGTPHRYLEQIGTSSMTSGIDRFITYVAPHYYISSISKNKIKDFIRRFINMRKLKFNYVNGSYSIGMSLVEYIVLISNEFISWYNELYRKGEVTMPYNRLKLEGFFYSGIISNGKIYYEENRGGINRYIDCIGQKVCTFKGKDITVNITDIGNIKNNNASTILNLQTALFILTIILKVLNYKYGRETDNSGDNQSSKKVWYL